MTGFSSIEVGAVVPVVLFFAGADALASWAACLVFAMAFVTQFPKRFVWRRRPFMAGRAEGRRPTMTSSFPSRAVACAVMYTHFVCYAALAVLNHTDRDVRFKLLGFDYSVGAHEMHHRHPSCNMAQYFMVWDRLMGTYRPYVDGGGNKGKAKGKAKANGAKTTATATAKQD